MADASTTCHDCGHSFEAHQDAGGCGLCDCARVWVPPRERKGKPKRKRARPATPSRGRGRGRRTSAPAKIEAPPEPPEELPF